MEFQAPRGTRDILPIDQPFWQAVIKAASNKAALFGFDKIDLPLFEDERVFTRAVGENTDIAEKELFRVSRAKGSEGDESKINYALRPEATASIVRSYLENGMATWPQPVRLWYLGSMFRYDRPQKGRYREFQQMGLELIGDESPAADALVILVMWEIIDALGLKDQAIVDINSLGCSTCRPRIKKTLIAYFSKNKNKLCPDCQRRLEKNPLRVLDCKNSDCQAIRSKAPQLIDLLDEDCRNTFQAVLSYLDELDIPYNLDPYLVRGLDYYTRTTFEIRLQNDNRRQNSLGGGGRYDNLIELYGGQPTPAIGFSLGLDRLVEVLKEKNQLSDVATPDVCVIQLGDVARKTALKLVQNLTRNNISVVIAPGKDAMKGQLRLANKVKAKLALIVGQQEAINKSIIIKNLDDSTQETVKLKDLNTKLKKKFGR